MDIQKTLAELANRIASLESFIATNRDPIAYNSQSFEGGVAGSAIMCVATEVVAAYRVVKVSTDTPGSQKMPEVSYLNYLTEDVPSTTSP